MSFIFDHSDHFQLTDDEVSRTLAAIMPIDRDILANDYPLSFLSHDLRAAGLDPSLIQRDGLAAAKHALLSERDAATRTSRAA